MCKCKCSDEVVVKVKKEMGFDDPLAVIPSYESEGAAGFDFKAQGNGTIEPGKVQLVMTGLFVAIPKGYEIQVRSRSGLAFKQNVFVLNSPGTVDSDYRGNIGIILANFGDKPFHYAEGDRLAQGVLCRVERAVFHEVESLDETPRGNKGFGSTGV